MEKCIDQSIPFLQDAKSITKLNKGYSDDEKFVVDGKYLVRIFPSDNEQKRREEFDTIQALAEYSKYVPSGLEFGRVENSDRSYMILTFLPGADAEEELRNLTGEEQYSAGFQAGKELRNLHKLQAPAETPTWYSFKKKKSDRYLAEFSKLDLDPEMKNILEKYITENESLMKDRPNTFQHDDFHPSNLLINNRKFSGIIDFQRMDWGDPIHDLQKLGFFSKKVSIEFTKGIIDGYHGNEILDQTFWELFTYYSAMHIVSALVWGRKLGGNNYERLLKYSLEVMDDHDDFRSMVPRWYVLREN
ncbi:aminoglycoside phosphotransferase family protein [Bacillus sp. FJAT-27245]|uniref:aminoglycoside phosphotransferase family protein n=1 Tax=Bacillus sp. FJAT-27245 TaxID=1684144 RepID=UPI0006A78D78|nr:aminoglycoside phosphotransferase family protein [Bacillus sp. FJAT-27245]